jgi:hypothetical protein
MKTLLFAAALFAATPALAGSGWNGGVISRAGIACNHPNWTKMGDAMAIGSNDPMTEVDAGMKWFNLQIKKYGIDLPCWRMSQALGD